MFGDTFFNGQVDGGARCTDGRCSLVPLRSYIHECPFLMLKPVICTFFMLKQRKEANPGIHKQIYKNLRKPVIYFRVYAPPLHFNCLYFAISIQNFFFFRNAFLKSGIFLKFLWP